MNLPPGYRVQRVRLSVVAEIVREWLEQLGEGDAAPSLDDVVLGQVLAASGSPEHGLVKYLDRRLRELGEDDVKYLDRRLRELGK